MKYFHFGRWSLECDPEATRRSYRDIPKGSAEECSCEPCLNFVAARAQIYGDEIVAIFDDLGIASEREAEIYHLFRLPSGLHYYGGWFHFVGRILSGSDVAKQVGEN